MSGKDEPNPVEEFFFILDFFYLFHPLIHLEFFKNIYNIKNVWFIADFNSAEEYNSVKIGQTYKVKGFGIRINFLGWYPTIYELTDL